MPNQAIQPPWLQPGWLEQASTWVHAALGHQGIDVTGAIDQPHVHSTVLRVPSTAGDIYFKAASPTLAHETALTQALWRWRPDCMPPVLAVDLARGWMLTPNLGVTLRSLVQSTRDLGHWERVLPTYAEVQIDLTSRVNELLGLGVLDRRLTMLPDYYEQLLNDTDALLIGHPNGISIEEHQRLRQFAPQFRGMCERLADYGIPETLHHEDFHDANIFVRSDHYTFADWGESGVAHPFCTWLVTSRVIAWRLALEQEAPELVWLCDVYLEPWTCYASRENLNAALKLAYRVGMVCRALTWRQVVAGEGEPFRSEHADAVPGWLQQFLNHDVTPTV